MIKNRWKAILDLVARNSKFVFPVILIAAVATTVTLALRAGDESGSEPNQPISEPIEEVSQTPQPTEDPVSATMERNTDGDLYSLIATYYNALALGDVDTIKSICSYLEDTEEIRIPEMANMWRVIP